MKTMPCLDKPERNFTGNWDRYILGIFIGKCC